MSDYYDKRSKNLRGCCWMFLVMVLAIILGVLFGSCSSVKYVPVVEHHTEYVTKTDSFIKKDSIFYHDSIYIHAIGDTVWYEKWHTKYIDKVREVVRTDSFIKRDSVPVPYPVERKLTKWEQTKIDWGGKAIVAIIVVIFITIWLIVEKFKLRR